MKLSPKDNKVHIELRRIAQDLGKKFSATCAEILSRYLQKGVDVRFGLNFKSGKEACFWCFISWFFEEPIRSLFQIQLYEKRRKWGPDYEVKISLLLYSPGPSLEYVLDSDVLGKNPNEVFGFLNGEHEKVRLYNWQEPKAKKIQRHRGYRDKGTLRVGSEYLSEEKRDAWLTELQVEIEKQRQELQDSISFWRGFLM